MLNAFCAARPQSVLQRHWLAEYRARELLCSHRLCEQKALHQVEAHFANHQKVGTRLDALRDSARAVALGKVEDLPADRTFQSIIGATRDELAIDLELDEGKVIEPDE